MRHKYDGTLTTNVAYPLTRALYGRHVRQPINGDYGFSGELARTYIESDSWTGTASDFGIDIWMTTVAMRSRVSVVQSFMGRPKIHKAKDQMSEAVDLFRDVVEAIFELMCRFEDFWSEVKWSRPTAVFGIGLGEVEVPPPMTIDTHALAENFTSGLQRNRDIYATILQAENLNKVEEVAELPSAGFEFPTALWAKVLYDFAVAYKTREIPVDELVAVLLPLYYGRTLSFVLETQPMNTQQVEEYIEDQCLQFEKTKPYLLERWRSG